MGRQASAGNAHQGIMHHFQAQRGNQGVPKVNESLKNNNQNILPTLSRTG